VKARQASELGNLQMIVALLEQLLEAQQQTNALLANVQRSGDGA
jgi:hypothetical protein